MNNVRIFWGVDHKVGTTMLAQSCAELKYREGKGSVLLLTLSENPGDDFFSGDALYLDDIRNRLACGLMDINVLKSNSAVHGGINKIHGLTNPQNMYSFTADMVSELIGIASEAYDQVIIDGGSGLHSPLTLSALASGGSIIFVMTQQESSIRKMEQLSENLSEHGIRSDTVVLNKYIKGDFTNPGHISQRTGLIQSRMKTVTDNEFGHQAESDKKTILHYGDKQFEKDVRNLI